MPFDLEGYLERNESKLKELSSKANFHYRNALKEFYQVGEILDELNSYDKNIILKGLEMAREEGIIGYENGHFVVKDGKRIS